MNATITNRFTGKQVTVRLKKSDSSLLYITSRQYNDALAKLGNGPLRTDTSFMVYAGDRAYASMDAE